MASDQLTGAIIRLYATEPNGNRHKVFEGVNEITGPGGSPDGVIATVKDNELPYMDLSPIKLSGGWKAQMTVELTVADGSDASDSIIMVPVQTQNGKKTLTAADFGYTVDYPAATAASVELPVGAGKTVPDGESWQLGGAKYFISIENDD